MYALVCWSNVAQRNEYRYAAFSDTNHDWLGWGRAHKKARTPYVHRVTSFNLCNLSVNETRIIRANMASTMIVDLQAFGLATNVTAISRHIPIAVWCCEGPAHRSSDTDNEDLNDGLQGNTYCLSFSYSHTYEFCLAATLL